MFEALPGWFIVTRGFVFPTDHFIPRDAVDRIRADDSIYLRSTKVVAPRSVWTNLLGRGEHRSGGAKDEEIEGWTGATVLAQRDDQFWAVQESTWMVTL